ncbi:hypothetical protein ABFG93_07355 [Pseudalkalibacillus hwajinpoensis]|uniref:hypothetical protein n=1 Tax=Guptibacillus hwajinpoensis TaxID=208199 RepID=UPI00325A6FC8
MGVNKTYIGFGIFFLLMSILHVIPAFFLREAPIPAGYMMFAMAVMSFCLSYLFPQFKMKDERSRMIREKGMFYSYFFMLGYIIVFIPLL